jgi:DNA polymerase-3 subunit alpha
MNHFQISAVVVENGEVTKKIRFGLNNIKNFGEEIGKAVIAERKKDGPFKTIEDFLSRVLHRNLNKKSLEALIMSGAMDSLGERGQLLANMEAMLTFNKECANDSGAQGSLFAGLDDAPKAYLKLVDAPATDSKQNLAWEKELLGLYVTGHPLEKYADRFKNAKQTMAQIKIDEKNGSEIVVAGIVEEVKEIYTKAKNEKMAFLRIADLTGSLECVVFPKSYVELQKFCQVDKLVIIKGKVSERNGERSVLIDKMKELV